MSSAPTKPIDVPPYQLQTLIAQCNGRCAQALGSEIYIGCENGELIRFALQADDPNTLESYSIISRQTLSSGKPVDQIFLLPSISRALVLADRVVHFYTLPALDLVPDIHIKPIRHVNAIAVDENHTKRPIPPLSTPASAIEPVDFCVIKRNGISMFKLQDRLFYDREIPFSNNSIIAARRTGSALLVADKNLYTFVDLDNASVIQLLPVNQAFEGEFTGVPLITVTAPSEFLILSWNGRSTLGLFINGAGDPVRGTLEWPAYPRAVVADYPYVATLLPNRTIEIHSIESQAIVQVLPCPVYDAERRLSLIAALSGYLVPSTQKSEKMRKVPISLIRE